MLLNPPSRMPWAVNRGGLLNARRTASATIADLYGTGMGQVPLHLDPMNAVMNGSVVQSLPNVGGAGAAFNATAGGVTITRTGLLLDLAVAADYLQLANPADLQGVRVFVVARRSTPGQAFFMGGTAAANGGTAVNMRWTHLTLADGATLGSRVQLQPLGYASGGFPRNVGNLVLYEFELLPTTWTVWTNGVVAEGGPVAGTYGSALMDQIGRSDGGTSTPSFSGGLGDMVSLIVDGTGNQAAQIALIRQSLAAKYGLTLG